MAIPPQPADHTAPTGWKRQPFALWMFLALGVGRILLSGADLVLLRRKR